MNVRAAARLRNRRRHQGYVGRGPEHRVRVALPGPETPGAEGVDRGQVGDQRTQPAREGVSLDFQGPQAAGPGTVGVGGIRPRRRAGHETDGGGGFMIWKRLLYLLPWQRRAAERDMQEELRSLAAMAEPGELGNLTLAA